MIKELFVKTNNKFEIIDLTLKIRKLVEESKVNEGIVLINVCHTTAAIIINENEKLLLEDIKNYSYNLAPDNKGYLHDQIHKRDCPSNEPLNAHAHLQAILMGSNKILPIANGKIILGTWQAIMLCELDGPRERRIVVKIINN